MNSVQRIVEIENDLVNVVRYRFGPHAKVPLHQAPDLVAVYLTDARLKLTFSDNTSHVEDRKTGEIVWMPARQHAGENLADTVLEFVAVQLK